MTEKDWDALSKNIEKFMGLRQISLRETQSATPTNLAGFAD